MKLVDGAKRLGTTGLKVKREDYQNCDALCTAFVRSDICMRVYKQLLQMTFGLDLVCDFCMFLPCDAMLVQYMLWPCVCVSGCVSLCHKSEFY